MSMTTASVTKAFLPEAVHSLIVQPVEAASIAMQVATVARPGPQTDFYRVPVVAGDPTAAWVAEGAEITPSDLEVEEVASPFYKVAGLTILSRELAEDSSPAAATLVGQGLARDIARKVDAAFFGSKGASTVQPAGLADLAGVNEIEAGATWTNVDPFAEAIYAAEGVGATVAAFVANPADALLLAKVKKQTGSNEPLLGTSATEATRRVIAGVPLLVSPAVAAGTVWGIPKERTVIALREDVTLDADKSAFFTSDRVAIKATLRMAALFPHAAAVQKVTVG